MIINLRILFAATLGFAAQLPLTADPAASSTSKPADSSTSLNSLNAPIQPVEPLQAPATDKIMTPGSAASAIDYTSATKEMEEREKPSEAKELTPQEQAAAVEKRQQEQNWLQNSYQQEVSSRAAAETGQELPGSVYDRIAADPDLARLAGIKPLQTDNFSKPSLKTSANSSQPILQLRPDGSSDDADSGAPANAKTAKKNAPLKPFLTPLSAPEAAGLHDFYANLPAAETAKTAQPSQLDQLAAVMKAGDDTKTGSTVDVPGLTGAQGRSESETAKADDTDLTRPASDMLPDASFAPDKKTTPASSFVAEAVAPSTASAQLQKEQVAQMSPPRPPEVEPPAPISPLLLNPAFDQKPVGALSPADFSKPKIADPFDILNR